MKKRLDALIKAGDEMRRLFGVSLECECSSKAKLKIHSMINEWEAARKAFR